MVLLSVLAIVGCKQSPTSNVLEKLDTFSNAMCACTNKLCADKVNADLTKWGEEMARSPESDQKPRPDVAKHAADMMTRYAECMTKLMMLPPVKPEAEAPLPATN